MNFEQALSLLREGKKVRLPEWTGYWFKSPYAQSDLDIEAFTRTGDIIGADVTKFASGDRDDWEEVTEGLGFDWALLCIKSGKRVKREGWPGFLEMRQYGSLWFGFIDKNGNEMCDENEYIDQDDLIATDWVLAD